MTSSNKRVLLGVTGCIAAYKACEILRGLQKADVDVHVIMTAAARRFVSEATFRALSGHGVGCDLFEDPQFAIPHIDMTKGIDAFLIAPATANTMAKIAQGLADDLMSSAALACPAPLILAPAMNVNMYENASTQANMEVLASRGIHFIDPASGRLACGDIGRGKLADVDTIVAETLRIIDESPAPGPNGDLSGKRVLVTAGPTREAIDAVRYISNPSTGRMGCAIAEAAQRRGAQVTLVLGPTDVQAPSGVDVIDVLSAADMLEAASDSFEDADIAIFTAAVSDFRPRVSYDRKLKKGRDDEALSTIDLVECPDILATLSHRKRPDQICIGFAAETNDVEANALKKLASKGADMIVGNSVGGSEVGFGSDRIDSVFITDEGVERNGVLTKKDLADEILTKATYLYH